MITGSDFFFWLALGLSVLALIAVKGALRRIGEVRREIVQLRRIQSIQETAILSLRGAMTAMSTGELGQEQRQEAMEQRMRELADRQESLLMRDPETRPYAQAIRMVQKGAPLEEIIDSCGLTRGEAELIVSLHGDPDHR